MEKKVKLLSKILGILMAITLMVVALPINEIKAEASASNSFEFDMATLTATIDIDIPTSFTVGSSIPSNVDIANPEEINYRDVEINAGYCHAVTASTEGSAEFNGKFWLPCEGSFEVGVSYGYYIDLHSYNRIFSSGPAVIVGGHTFTDLVEYEEEAEYIAFVDLGTLNANGTLSGGEFDAGNGGSGSSPEPTPSEPAEAQPDMTTVNIEGATFNTWEEITVNTPNLTAEKLQKVNSSNDDLLHVNIVGKEDKTVPASAVAAMDKSSIGGLHVFIGESDAVTFLNNIDYSKYAGMNFKHEDEVTENSRTIDFTSKGKLNAVLVFHTLIVPNKKAYVYKVVDGKEVLVGTASSNSNGGFCFAIDELAKYVIKY